MKTNRIKGDLLWHRNTFASLSICINVGQHLAASRFVSRLEQQSHLLYYFWCSGTRLGRGLGRPGLIDIKAHTHSHRCAPAYKHTHACSNVLMDRRLWHSNSSRTDLCQALGVWLHVTIKIKQSCRHNHIIQAFFFPALTYRPSPPALKSRADTGGFCFTHYVSRQAVRRLLWLY